VGNAYFGIKGKAPTGDSSSFGTTEVINGKVIHTKAEFRAYQNYADSADPVKFVEAIAKAGYATDPNYATSLQQIIQSNHLDQYDK
jgi:flagellum-specific peptidoglycan hydrolase FlgJ